MCVTLEEKACTKEKATEYLNKLKEVESKTAFYTKKVGKTIICCKNEDRIKEYEKTIKSIKITQS